jgi:beta-galactosidase
MGLCEVSVNRQLAAFHPYGYTGFFCDLSPYLKDGENELTVTADTTAQVSSRWYTGGGIYRNAELLTAGTDYLLPWGIYVKTLRLYDGAAAIEAEIRIRASRAGEGTLTVTAAGASHTHHIHADEGENTYSFRYMLKNVSLWTPDTPVLYDCSAELDLNGQKDADSVSFGVRTADTDPERGLLLNGKPVKLYGACIHHDNGIVGAASFRSAEERRVRILKENGFNAIRTAHNPPSAVMLDVCDRMGMLVIDEIFDCWRVGKKEFDYHLWFEKYWEEDTRSMVLRDRNHPSVVLWSTGNEIPEKNGSSNGYHTHKGILDVIRTLDPTRPVTHAFCTFWDNWDLEQQAQKENGLGAETLDFWAKRTMPIADLLDVSGYNYLYDRLDKDEIRFPDRLIAMTESFPLDAVLCAERLESDPRFIGEFVWTGWDYFGETGIGHVTYGGGGGGYGLTGHPAHIANCGDFAVTGFKKPQSFFRDAAWELRPVTVLSSDPAKFGQEYAISSWGFYDAENSWTWPGTEGKKTEVFVFTRAYEAELFVNGESVGRKKPDKNGTAKFEADYHPGKLTARAYGPDGECVGEDEIVSTGEWETIGIRADKTGKSGAADLLFLEISLLDKNGSVSFTADDEIEITVEGGTVLGTGSGRVDDEHIYTDAKCRAYHGMLLAAVRPESADCTVTVSAPGKDSPGTKTAVTLVLHEN